MRNLSIILLIVFFQSNSFGQMSVMLSQKDTSICKGSSVRISSSMFIGTLKYLGTNGVSDYFMDTISRSWSDARNNATANGMDLWVIDSADENNFVYYNLIPQQPNTFYWIGLSQDPAIETAGGPASGWYWVDGRLLDTTFKNWAFNEPDDIFGLNTGANYASIGLNTSGANWSDMTDNIPGQYRGFAIVEKPHAILSFKWSNLYTGNSIDVAPTVTTSYNLELTYGTFVKTSSSTVITVNSPKAIASFILDPSSYTCVKKNLIVFSNKTSTTDPSTTYLWNFGDGTTANTTSVSHQYSAVQSYTVTLTATDANGCSTSVNGPVTIKKSPDPFVVSYATGTNSFCDGDSVFLKTIVTQTDPSSIYSWYLGLNTVSTGSTYTAKVGGTYLLVATISNGCKDTAFVNVTVNPLPAKPVISIGTGFTSVFCQTDSTKLQASTISAVSKYSWYTSSNPNPNLISGVTIQNYYAKAPTGMSGTPVVVNYLVRAIDSKNCYSPFSDPIAITTKPSPSALITSGTSPVVFCEGDSVQLNLVTPVSTNVHEWFKDNLLYASGVTKIVAKNTGVYNIKETNLYSCSVYSNSFNVVVNKYPNIPNINPDLPVPEILSDGQVNICTGSNVTIRTSSVTGGSYQWYYNNAIMTGFTGVSATVNKAGTYSVTLKVNGCTTPSSGRTIGLLPLPVGTLIQPPVTTICDGYDINLTASNATSYQWYFNNNKIAGAISNSFKAVTPGTYQVEFISDKGCKAMSSNFIFLTLIKKPTAAFTYDLYCVNTASNFTNQSTTPNSGSVDYLWRFQNGLTDNSINPVHVFTSSGLYKVTLVVSPIACPMLADSLSSNIQVEAPTPGVSYVPINAMIAKPQGLVARSFGDFYEWKPATGLNSPFIRIPILTPTTEQLYTVKITDRAGCVTIDSQLVRIFDEQDVFVAGGFTPNNDGKNDKIYPMLVGVSSFSYLKIFNRWGNLVFQTDSTDPAKGWDGRYQGKDQPADTYTYVLEATGNNGRLIRKSGSIILIR